MISFTVPGLPIAQPRQRHRNITARNGASFIQNYTPTKSPVNEFKAAVRMAFAQACGGQPLDGPVALRVLFVFPRPKGMIWKKRPMPGTYHAKKPDLDNLAKSLKDALKGLAWLDDSQVAQMVADKVIAAGDEQARTEVRIRRLVEPAVALSGSAGVKADAAGEQGVGMSRETAANN